MTHAAVSVLGKDRPGIVAAISKVFFDTGCNIEDSTMTSLLNEFAMILIVALPKDLGIPELQNKLAEIGEKLGLTITLRSLVSEEERKPKPAKRPYLISVYGSDKPGIVYKITQLLADNKVNITDVQTNISKEKEKPVYIMLLEIDLPETLKFEVFKSQIEKAASSLNIALTIHPVEENQL